MEASPDKHSNFSNSHSKQNSESSFDKRKRSLENSACEKLLNQPSFYDESKPAANSSPKNIFDDEDMDSFDDVQLFNVQMHGASRKTDQSLKEFRFRQFLSANRKSEVFS